jgi:nitric oxide reductase subunit B
MVVGNLFAGGVLQLQDVLKKGCRQARRPEYLNQAFVRSVEWCRLPGDTVFILLGVVPLVIAALLTSRQVRTTSAVGP